MNFGVASAALGGGLSEDIDMMAEVSAEAMRLDRLVKQADELMKSIQNKEVSEIWNSLTQAQKKVAVKLAEKDRRRDG